MPALHFVRLATLPPFSQLGAWRLVVRRLMWLVCCGGNSSCGHNGRTAYFSLVDTAGASTSRKLVPNPDQADCLLRPVVALPGKCAVLIGYFTCRAVDSVPSISDDFERACVRLRGRTVPVAVPAGAAPCMYACKL